MSRHARVPLALIVVFGIGACSDGSSTTPDADAVLTDAPQADVTDVDATVPSDATVPDAIDDATSPDAADVTVEDATVDTVEDTTVEDATVEDTTVEDATVEDTAVDATDDTAVDVTDTVDAAPAARVVVNEVAAVGLPDDWIELYNAGDADADLSGWLVRDDDPLHGYVFPDGTTLAAGAYLVATRGVELDFGLGGADSAQVVDASGAVVDLTTWAAGDSPADASWGRIPNGTGDFETLLTPTPGAANVPNAAGLCPNGAIDPGEVCDGAEHGGLTCQSFGWGGGALACVDECARLDQSACTAHAAALVINEVTSSGDDTIELLNGGAAEVDLAGYALLDDAANTYVFAAGTKLAAHARLVLTKGADHAFGLGGADAVLLVNPQGVTVDMADWIDGEAVVSYCRIPDGTGGFRACATSTFGDVNAP